MNKKGFAFIETIITIVILSSALLYLYSSYSAIISEEETRLHYDDVAYIYYTNNVRKFLEEYSNIEDVKKNAFNNRYIEIIGTGYDGLFDSDEKNMAEKIVQSYNINQIILVKATLFNDCLSSENGKCKDSFSNVGYNLKNYINTISDTSYDYYLIVEYATKVDNGNIVSCRPGIDERCNSYYSSLGI